MARSAIYTWYTWLVSQYVLGEERKYMLVSYVTYFPLKKNLVTHALLK